MLIDNINTLAFSLFELVILLHLKHLICDFIIQTPLIAESKIRYGSINSIIHIIHHAFGTMVVGLIVGLELGPLLGIIALEALLHYHIDWVCMKFGAKSYKDKRYWQWFGIEQFLHNMTIITIVIMTRYFLLSNS